MYVLYSIGVILILLTIVDVVYFSSKKISEIMSKKSGKVRNFEISLLYPLVFLICSIARIFIADKSVVFIILLKECILWGILGWLLVLNIKTIKNRLLHTKDRIDEISNFEISEDKKLFHKKDEQKNENK